MLKILSFRINCFILTHPNVFETYTQCIRLLTIYLFVAYFYYSLADVNVINNDDLLYKVRYDGSVMWEIPRIFTTYCEVDITYFPFDTQTCTIELTSWAYNTNQVMLHHLDDQINTEDFK